MFGGRRLCEHALRQREIEERRAPCLSASLSLEIEQANEGGLGSQSETKMKTGRTTRKAKSIARDERETSDSSRVEPGEAVAMQGRPERHPHHSQHQHLQRSRALAVSSVFAFVHEKCDEERPEWLHAQRLL